MMGTMLTNVVGGILVTKPCNELIIFDVQFPLVFDRSKTMATSVLLPDWQADDVAL